MSRDDATRACRSSLTHDHRRPSPSDRLAVRDPPGTSSKPAAKNATQDIPILIAGIADPVGSGLVRSIARPGANITGVAAMMQE